MNQMNDPNSLPMMALNEIPTPKENAKKITALVKESGKVTGYQLSDGQTISKADGVMMAKNGEIEGVGVAVNQGTEYLKSLPDGDESNNLGNLPSIS